MRHWQYVDDPEAWENAIPMLLGVFWHRTYMVKGRASTDGDWTVMRTAQYPVLDAPAI